MMKRIVCAVLALLLVCSAAFAEGSVCYFAELPDTACSGSLSEDAVMEIYDDLLERYPDRLTVETLGTDAKGNEIVALTYDLAPSVEKPEIVLCCGTHGDEKAAVLGMALFTRDLCSRSDSDPALGYLARNVRLCFIPLLNPSGFALNTRYNAAGANLNRDFGKFKSPETKLMRDLLAREAAAHDVIAVYDYHNDVGSCSLWKVGKDSYIAGMAKALDAVLAPEWTSYVPELKKYSPLLDCYTSDNTGTLTTYAKSLGYTAATLETARHLEKTRNKEDRDLYNALGVKSGMDIVGNVLLYTLLGGRMLTQDDLTVPEDFDLEFPNDVKLVDEEAFKGTAFSSADAPNGLLAIGESAFAECPNLDFVRMTASVAEIAETAFPEGVVLCAPEGSPAHSYALAHGFAWIAR